MLWNESAQCRIGNHQPCKGWFWKMHAPQFGNDPGFRLGQCKCECHHFSHFVDFLAFRAGAGPGPKVANAKRAAIALHEGN